MNNTNTNMNTKLNYPKLRLPVVISALMLSCLVAPKVYALENATESELKAVAGGARYTIGDCVANPSADICADADTSCRRHDKKDENGVMVKGYAKDKRRFETTTACQGTVVTTVGSYANCREHGIYLYEYRFYRDSSCSQEFSVPVSKCSSTNCAKGDTTVR